MNKYKCNYCGKIFNNNNYLYKHKHRSQKCIKLQKQFNENINDEFCFDCDKVINNEEHICEKLNQNYETLNKDNQKLKQNYEKINKYNEKLKKDYQKLNQDYKNLKLQLNKNNNDKNILTKQYMEKNFKNISFNFILDKANKYYTKEHMNNLMNGLIDYSLNFLLKDNIICTDLSRKTVKYKDENGTIISDSNLCKIYPLIFKSVLNLNLKYMREIITENKISEINIEKMNDFNNDIFDGIMNLNSTVKIYINRICSNLKKYYNFNKKQNSENINEEFCFDCDKVIINNEEHICLISLKKEIALKKYSEKEIILKKEIEKLKKEIILKNSKKYIILKKYSEKDSEKEIEKLEKEIEKLKKDSEKDIEKLKKDSEKENKVLKKEIEKLKKENEVLKIEINNNINNNDNDNKDSKGEIECRRVLEEFFNKKFEKCRLDFLKNPISNYPLELDCYNKELKLGVEYNGQQHYKLTPFFHKTKEQFENQKYRDYIKRELCKKEGVILVEISYIIKIENIEEYICNELNKNNFVKYVYN